MKIAIMQPYIFPYIGYFQLLNYVDKFVILDDVTFIKKGWINRNRMLVGRGERYKKRKPLYFTVPLVKISQNKYIKDTLIHENYLYWKDKFYKQLNSYKVAPFFNQTKKLVKNVFDSCQPGESISKLCNLALHKVSERLLIDTKIVDSSKVYDVQSLKGQVKIIKICKVEGASEYCNLSGGQHLYNYNDFKINNIKLNFISSNENSYLQFGSKFIPHMSIIDVLMFNGIDRIREMLENCEIKGDTNG
jgi:hypothetical protein